MPRRATSAPMIQDRTKFIRVLVSLGGPGLVLDRPADSVTLEVASTKFARACARPFLARGGQNESSRAPTTDTPQPSDAPAFPRPGRSFRQDRAFYGSSERLARRLLLCLIGSPAGRNAHRSDPAHARGSDREFRPGDALHRAGRSCA